MVSLPPAITTMTPILALIALALALSRTRIGQRGGGCTVTHLICRCHGCRHWRHLCLHSRDDGAKDDGCGNRRGRNPNIHGQEGVGHHYPIGVEQQKQKQKQKQKHKHKHKHKQNQQQWWQRHRLYACRQLCPCCHHCYLCISRGSRGGSNGGSGGSSSSRAVAVTAHYFELPRSIVYSCIAYTNNILLIVCSC
jgi:hypothetical protein